jgi:hypothetical protein
MPPSVPLSLRLAVPHFRPSPASGIAIAIGFRNQRPRQTDPRWRRASLPLFLYFSGDPDMFPTGTLSDQQVITLYVIGTVLTVYPVALLLAGALGFFRREAASKA